MADLSISVEFSRTSTVLSSGAGAPFSGVAVGRTSETFDLVHGGAGRIASTVKKDADPVDLPMRRKVRLFREVDGLFLRETWSHAVTGAYAFNDLNPAYLYTVISYDFEKNFRAVIADGITAVVAA